MDRIFFSFKYQLKSDFKGRKITMHCASPKMQIKILMLSFFFIKMTLSKMVSEFNLPLKLLRT